MKKQYHKPEIFFEDFALSESISVGCEVIVDGPHSGACGYVYEGGNGQTMFTNGVGTDICNIGVDDDADNGFCYFVPVETNNLFNS